MCNGACSLRPGRFMTFAEEALPCSGRFLDQLCQAQKAQSRNFVQNTQCQLQLTGQNAVTFFMGLLAKELFSQSQNLLFAGFLLLLVTWRGTQSRKFFKAAETVRQTSEMCEMGVWSPRKKTNIATSFLLLDISVISGSLVLSRGFPALTWTQTILGAPGKGSSGLFVKIFTVNGRMWCQGSCRVWTQVSTDTFRWPVL